MPQSIGNLEELRELDIADNQLNVLPDSAVSGRLEKIDLSNNRLTFLPEKVGSLQSLIELTADQNAITLLPKSLGRSRSLRLLSIRGNPIDQVPPMPQGCVVIASSGPTSALLQRHIKGGPQPGFAYFENPPFFFDILLSITGFANLASLLILYFKNQKEVGSVDLTFANGTRLRLGGLTRQKAMALAHEHEVSISKDKATIDVGSGDRRAIIGKLDFVEDVLLRVPEAGLIERDTGKSVSVVKITN